MTSYAERQSRRGHGMHALAYANAAGINSLVGRGRARCKPDAVRGAANSVQGGTR
jgi:hypothetical protein